VSVRLRLTLLYVGLFLASGACLLTMTYFLVRQQLPGVTSNSGVIAINGGSGGSAGIVSAAGSAAGACNPAQAPGPEQLGSCQQVLEAVAMRVGRGTLNQLLIESGVALGLMALVSVGLGWVMAGRVLRPLRVITATARRISARNLHQRIAMSGPDDELKELGEVFDQLLGRLEASFRAQRQFVANASHELRTPLARQRTLLEVALRDPDATPASLRAAGQRALAANEQSEQLIAALLTLARGERGLDRFEPVDLAGLAAGVLGARREDADAARVRMVPSLAPATACGDPGLAERLMANLVDNAISYNAAGGQVEVATGTRAGGPYLAVTNTGPVIPPDQLGRLFQPFQRMDPVRRAPGGAAPGLGGAAAGLGGAAAGLGGAAAGLGGAAAGLGLGLAIVSAIAAAHGAELRAVTRAGGGLAIEVRFPAPAGRTMDHALGGVRDQQDPGRGPGPVRPALPGRGPGGGLGTAVRRDQRGRRRLRSGPPGAGRRRLAGLRGGR
jgi:signal transduction histidine kinase